MLSDNPRPPSRGREKRGKRRETYKLNIKSFTDNINNTNNINNKRNNTILSFPELVAGHWHCASSCQAAPGNPGLDLAVNRNWTQECTDHNLDQDRRQDSEHGPLQKQAMDEETKTLMIPQL